MREIEPGVFECSGRVEIESLRENYHLDIPEDDDYQTLAGYILHSVGQIPAEGETMSLDGKLFTIIRRTATRLELIRIAPAPAEQD